MTEGVSKPTALEAVVTKPKRLEEHTDLELEVLAKKYTVALQAINKEIEKRERGEKEKEEKVKSILVIFNVLLNQIDIVDKVLMFLDISIPDHVSLKSIVNKHFRNLPKDKNEREKLYQAVKTFSEKFRTLIDKKEEFLMLYKDQILRPQNDGVFGDNSEQKKLQLKTFLEELDKLSNLI